ncbi:MAG TPA: DNA internalization-related competence protein ComEC/Rec2 [Burkholderiaceae bacterium]|jgi:competence protein ComEC|nr:DNA internalization-related competence protein ComEC/Rec2 [Burkholderiaceae bacterium]
MVYVLVAFVAAVAWLQQASDLPAQHTIAAMLVAATMLASGAMLVRRICAPAARVAACLAAALLGYDYAAWIADQRLADELSFADEGRDIQVTGIIAGLPTQIERGVRFTFEVEQVDSPQVHVPRLIALSWYQSPDGVRPAQRWRMAVKLRRPHGSFNPAGFDSELWMLEQGVRASGYVRDGAGQPRPLCLQDPVWRFNPMIDRARDGLRGRLQRLLQGRRYGGVIIALVMGDQALIAQSDWTLFNRTGISHLVSISGLHITMIAGLVALAAGAAWRLSHRLVAVSPVQTVRAIAGAFGALGYCLLAGWGVPAQRTFVMLATVAAALLLRLQLSAAAILSTAAAVVCLWDPWAVTATGFWLSFGAVASIFLVCHGRVPPAGRSERADDPERRWLGRLLAWRAWLGGLLHEATRVQAAVTIGLVPLTLVLFQQVSLISPIANAIAIPTVSYLVTPLALLGALVCCLGQPMEPAAQLMLQTSDALFGLLAGMLNWLVQLPYAWVGFAAPPAWAVGVAGIGIFWLLAPAGWPLRWVGAAWLVPAFVMPPERPGPGALWLTALDVGQGMALVAETAEATLVFDTGPKVSEESDAGARVIVPYLHARGIDRVALLVISHLDSDHSGGTRSLIDTIKVERVLTSIDPDQPMLQAAHDLQRCEAGQRASLGALQLTVLNPPAVLYDRPRATTNEKSCVILAQLGAIRALLTGDVPAREEAGMVAAFASGLQAQFLVAPHHGSKTSSSEVFVSAVQPRWVSVQAGYRSRFGHPHPDVVARYAQHGARLVRSDWSGAARWRFGADGSVALEQWRLDHARYWLNQPAKWVNSSSDQTGELLR